MSLRLAFLALMATAAPAAAQSPVAPSAVPPQRLTIERLFASPTLTGSAPRLLKLSPDGKLATLLRNRPDDIERYDLWGIDTQTGAARMLVDSKKVGSGAALSEAERMQRERARIGGLTGIVDYEWAPDGTHILVPIDGDIYLADLAGGVRRLTNTPDTELDATVSERGGYVSYVLGGNLHVIALADGGDRAVTQGGGGTIAWGLAEFVAQEEMDRFRGHWWAPDDSRIAVERYDEAKVEISVRAAIGAEKTTTFEQRYPRAGTANAAVELWLMNPDGTGAVKADLGGDPDVYLARVAWLPDAGGVIVQRETRDQKRLDVIRIDARTGAATPLFSETAKTWINLSSDLRALDDGSLLWSSERDGYRHLYLWRKGRFTQLTRGPWMTVGVTGIDQGAKRLYFAGFKDSTVERHIYALDYGRRGAQPVRLTAPGTINSAIMDKGGQRMLVSSSAPGQPGQVYLADRQGARIAWVEQNAVTPAHPWAPYAAAAAIPRFGKITGADGRTKLDYRLLLPSDLPAGAKAPVLVRVYGGPTAHDVLTGFVSPLDQYFQQQGWIVFQVANRGGDERGVAFQTPVYRALGTAEVADQLAGLAWLKAQPFVDPRRVALFGWSYGGYMVLKLLEAAPHAFTAGVAVAPVTRWELYDTHYTERYLGNPAADPKPYEAASALGNALAIDDPLLLIHGLSDDNVLFENSSAFMAKMQEGKRPFETMLYPGKTHAISGANTSVHLYHTIENFLDRTVKNAK